MRAAGACAACLARSWLLVRLAGHLDLLRDRTMPLLALADSELIAAVAGAQRALVEHERDRFDADAARRRAATAGLDQVCRCSDAYPAPLAALAAPPAVLHIAGGIERLQELVAGSPVALVGARRPSPYGTELARSLGRGVAAAGLTVLSGMAQGIDSAAHRGALDADGPTVAVLAGAAELPYPAGARALHERIRVRGAVVSELPPGTRARRWMFPARNRLIAALGAMTVLVEARAGSGALLTARFAAELGRRLGATPGRVTSPLAHGPHQLLRDGALLIERPQDVLDGLFGADTCRLAKIVRPALEPPLQALFDALAEGHDTPGALAAAKLDADRGLAALAALELAGRIRREPGGRYSVSA
jgi:DNA processing protein